MLIGFLTKLHCMKKTLLVLFSFTSFFGFSQADNDQPDILTVGAGAGFTSFIGDLQTDSEVSSFSMIRKAFVFNLERRFGQIAAAQIDVLYGSLSYNERSPVVANNRNFESPLLQVGGNFTFHFDDDIIINRKSPFSPYVSAGVSFLKFDAHSDLLDSYGNSYYYWDDGTIRDEAFNGSNDTTTVILQRDYNYETQLTDSVENYSRNSLSIPLTFGLKWKFTPRIQGRVYGSYNLALTDWIDNAKENNNNDKFIYAGFSLHYVIKKQDQELKHRYDDVDFDALKSNDEDGDGIIDTEDQCQGTPEGIEIDAKGCPMDEDGDGVPDYLDKEKGTKKGVVVDEEGRELTDEMLAQRIAQRDSIATVRHETFSDDASLETLNKISHEIESTNNDTGNNKTAVESTIPEELKEADINGNGLISASEITAAIDGFFEGSNDFTVKRLHQLINYFFEQ